MVNEEGTSIAIGLAAWAHDCSPTPADRELARTALVDTLAVSQAGSGSPLAARTSALGEAGRLAVLAHVLDYDDLHLPSTAHISAVCVPVALATGGGERAYLAGAGVMARLGAMLGWESYERGWHTTCTAGAPAAAAAAAVAADLDVEGIARAMALAVPAAGGVHRAFGSDGKCLQVGFAADAGVRAAGLAAAGASADPRALDDWLALLGGGRLPVERGPAVPNGLAIKPYPCCYALQRPIECVREALGGRSLAAEEVTGIAVSLPADSIRPLIHSRPKSGLEAKFSLEYGLAAAVLDGRPGLWSFGDEAAARPEAKALGERVSVSRTADVGGGLLAGSAEVELALAGGESLRAGLDAPPGAPDRPLTRSQLAEKVSDCVGQSGAELERVEWDSATAADARG